MKKMTKISAVAIAMAISGASFAQLQDEQDVTITMDLQPILQLKMEGPDQIDFTFDEINKYYTGVVKTGANILKVSSSVSFDLWAVGVSTGSIANNAYIWDNPMVYGTGSVASNAQRNIPLTALELHQFPANPQTGAAATCAGVTVANFPNYDYSSQFAPYSAATNSLGSNVTNTTALAGNTAGNNCIYSQTAQLAYMRPTTAAAATDEKYIAGANGVGAGCQVNAGSYLFGSVTSAGAVTNQNASQTSGGYYFVMDYRILPGLPARFPATGPAANATNATATYMVNGIAASTAAGGPQNTANTYAAPGVYTMFVKYILQEDQ